MNIIIFGASGKTGQELVKQALAKGHHVCAFVRNPSKLTFAHDNLKIFQGDAINYQLVEEAVQGQYAVFSTLGAASPFNYDQSVDEGISNIVKAMEKNGVRRLIYMSAINVKDSRKNAGLLIRVMGTTLLRTETAGHEAREKIIKQSGLDWTLVRSGALNNGKHTTNYRHGEEIRAKGIAAGISRADVADFLLRQLTDLSYLRKTPIVMY